MRNIFIIFFLFALTGCSDKGSRLERSIENLCNAYTFDYERSLRYFENSYTNKEIVDLIKKEELNGKFSHRLVALCSSCRGEDNYDTTNKLFDRFSILSSNMDELLGAKDSVPDSEIKELKHIITEMSSIVKKINDMPVQD